MEIFLDFIFLSHAGFGHLHQYSYTIIITGRQALKHFYHVRITFDSPWAVRSFAHAQASMGGPFVTVLQSYDLLNILYPMITAPCLRQCGADSLSHFQFLFRPL